MTNSNTEYADDDEPIHRSRRKSANSTMTTQSKAEIARNALTELKAQQKGVGSVVVHDTIRVGGDGLLVLLARREKNGRITILGSSNDPTQIDAVAALVVQTNLTNLAPNLRTIVEVVGTQIFPPHALPMSPEQRRRWFRTRYPDKSDLWQGDLERLDRGWSW